MSETLLQDYFISLNPTTGKVIETITASDVKQIDDALTMSQSAFPLWKKRSVRDRAQKLKHLSAYLIENEQRYAALITAEMGKTIKEARAEIKKCALCCDYYAANAESFLKDEPIAVKQGEAWISYQPLGTVLAIMPWNFPFWQAFRCAIPAITAGNTMILKHASNVSRCALEIEDMFREVGYPEGVFKTLLVSRDTIPDLIKHQAIQAVSLTGSVEAGRQVAKAAGSEIKKAVLELGGSDPYIILEDADLDLAAAKCAESRLLNSGQSCIAAKRFIVVEPVADLFIKKFAAAMAAKKIGNPMDERTDLGPLARSDLRDILQRQVAESIAKGAQCILGGKIPTGDGFFYPPTVLVNVKKGMPAYEEELFGPVASIIRARDESDAFAIANDTEFGLGGALFTKNIERGKMLLRNELDSGFCALNDLVRSDPSLPFGGIKTSGYGRELSQIGIREFVNIKTLKIASEF